ncbi:Hypothetical protein CINCED_3A016649 [Cinara cedri]|uniref:DNA-directed DNA polymerase n=1 Tax=Cinara cedri TaxID=506608 RepID=A0A5E4MLB1_9HEMI|nr:Hypothetical protein CINCED_3A016649 [Cinara cedri]
MENYRNVSIKHFKLDPVHYYTTPGFAWNAILRKTGVELELIREIDMYLMFEQGIRGGLSQCSIRYSKASNKYIGEKRKEKTSTKYLLDLDANNLYRWAILGLKLEKIHRIIEFDQKDWLKPYIEFNINLRAKTDNEFEKDYYKLMKNSVFVPGKFKDELNGQIITEFVGLRSKLYSIEVFENENEIKKAKGVKKPIVKNGLCFNDFYNCLKSKNSKYVKQNTFRPDKHEIYTVEKNKKAFSVYDDKRYILDNDINTLAWRHYSTNIKRENFKEYTDNLIKTNSKKE